VKTYQLFLLSILSGMLLAFAWFPVGFVPLVFIGFVPLLLVERTICLTPEKYKKIVLFGCSYLAFFTWNILVTWWVKNASVGGAAMAILANSLLMAFVFTLFHIVKKRVDNKFSGLLFICFWITFEFLHLDWDLTWTWLTLGNVFAVCPNCIQWYEYTGVFGGSLWILLLNVLIFEMYINRKVLISKAKIVGIVLLLIIPIVLSYLILSSCSGLAAAKNNSHKVVIVQPNIDPYNEKFDGSYEAQLQKMLALAIQKTDSATEYLIFPETALTEDMWENEFEKSTSIQTLKLYIKQFPKLKIIIGASTGKIYQPNEALSTTARKFTQEDAYYDSYNTALQIDNSNRIQVYHKSKLVPGVEMLPFPFIFKYFEKFAIDLGGTNGSLGKQAERTVFTSPDNTTKAAPVVCYESIYGEYVSTYINNGAQFIAIITNDGWWGDTPGYKQHLKYGALRAIETRKWVVRSANTGVSCFINPLGGIQQATQWWVPAVIEGNIELNNNRTFYTRYGDYIARIAMYASLLLIIYSILIRFKIINKR
jgi:apolipoprotein N-acyltransferase